MPFPALIQPPILLLFLFIVQLFPFLCLSLFFCFLSSFPELFPFPFLLLSATMSRSQQFCPSSFILSFRLFSTIVSCSFFLVMSFCFSILYVCSMQHATAGHIGCFQIYACIYIHSQTCSHKLQQGRGRRNNGRILGHSILFIVPCAFPLPCSFPLAPFPSFCLLPFPVSLFLTFHMFVVVCFPVPFFVPFSFVLCPFLFTCSVSFHPPPPFCFHVPLILSNFVLFLFLFLVLSMCFFCNCFLFPFPPPCPVLLLVYSVGFQLSACIHTLTD